MREQERPEVVDLAHTKRCNRSTPGRTEHFTVQQTRLQRGGSKRGCNAAVLLGQRHVTGALRKVLRY